MVPCAAIFMFPCLEDEKALQYHYHYFYNTQIPVQYMVQQEYLASIHLPLFSCPYRAQLSLSPWHNLHCFYLGRHTWHLQTQKKSLSFSIPGTAIYEWCLQYSSLASNSPNMKHFCCCGEGRVGVPAKDIIRKIVCAGMRKLTLLGSYAPVMYVSIVTPQSLVSKIIYVKFHGLPPWLESTIKVIPTSLSDMSKTYGAL